MLKAREQSKKLNYTDQFKIDHITLHGIFLSLQSFILRYFKAFIFGTRVHVAQKVLMISFEILSAFLEREYKKQFDAGV